MDQDDYRKFTCPLCGFSDFTDGNGCPVCFYLCDEIEEDATAMAVCELVGNGSHEHGDERPGCDEVAPMVDNSRPKSTGAQVLALLGWNHAS